MRYLFWYTLERFRILDIGSTFNFLVKGNWSARQGMTAYVG